MNFGPRARSHAQTVGRIVRNAHKLDVSEIMPLVMKESTYQLYTPFAFQGAKEIPEAGPLL